MARSALVLDASVGVKWFSPKDEAALNQALAIKDAQVSHQIQIIVPDLFYYEVTNAIIHKKYFPVDMVQAVASALFALRLQTIPVNASLLNDAVTIARQFEITTYDSIYLAIAIENGCPLVTANPRHQRQELGCQVITLDQWK
jgi:predicted nucleic acid-binding protein